MVAPPFILIVDDEVHIRKILSIMLTKNGYTVKTAENGREAIDLAQRNKFDAVITDLRMPVMDGLELLKNLKDSEPELPVIVVTAFSTVETAIEAMKQGASDYISKPFKEDELMLVLEKALERKRILDENRRLKEEIRGKYDFSNFIGHSEAMRKVFDIIAKVAETKSTVLITGESGTGKELAARAIHYNSPRKDRPFVPINCGAVPVNLLESEFFGHVKGAFSGADKHKKGLLAEADGGTLFLDEVSELPLDMQVKVLRAIQEEEIRRIGDTQTQKVDLRVVAATNKDLHEEVMAGRFRDDLHYRLKVIELKMPPLRERVDDIPLLAHHFLKDVVAQHNLESKSLSPEAIRALTRQTWSGNVRALRNVIEQSAIMSEKEIIRDKDLPFQTGQSPSNGFQIQIPEDIVDLKAALKVVSEATEVVIIRRVLEKHNHNRTHAAKELGISRRALINKIHAYGMDEDR